MEQNDTAAYDKWGPEILRFNRSKRSELDLPSLSPTEVQAVMMLAKEARLKCEIREDPNHIVLSKFSNPPLKISHRRTVSDEAPSRGTWQPPSRKNSVRVNLLNRRSNILSRLSGQPIEKITFDPTKMALVLVEFQNEFATEGGKLFPFCKEMIEETGIMEKTASLCAVARDRGVNVVHCPISFAQDNSDNPQQGFGMLKSCADMDLCKSDSWQAAFCDTMRPMPTDVVVQVLLCCLCAHGAAEQARNLLVYEHRFAGYVNPIRMQHHRARWLPHQLLRGIDHAFGV
eukprot:TRINITY_DN1874_c0_g1_i4.p1 TRINITY_DN1874_c0_g1~~TRINITY_DN1874_c0_g1_i4.p1  ORF type:complete len:287 (-),score=47.19 TRINITY_DN1874_c0_g1_i4:504-1364(-)